MKTAVSIPDEIYQEAEHLAEVLQTSRSQLYARALAEFLARHDSDKIIEAMNATINEVGAEEDEFSEQGAKSILRQVEW